MTTYPLTFPAVSVASSTFCLNRATSASTSPFTFSQQVYKHQGSRWQGSVQFRPVRRPEATLIQSFLAELDGQYGTFLYGDPDAIAGGRLGAGGGTPLVVGGSQTGTTLAIDGATASVTRWLKKGDYFSLGTGTASRLYCMTQDADTNSSGATTLNFRPALRSSPSDNDPLNITTPRGLFRLENNLAEWSSNENSVYNFGLSFVEVIE